LEETIRSVLLQGYPNLEHFIIDGGSQDQSLEIIRKYEPWLTGWVSEKDRGQSHAINKGFARSTGDLLTFQNSDDFYLPGAFEDAARRWMADQSVGIVAGGFHYVDGTKMRQESIPARLPRTGPIDLVITREPWRIHQVSVFYARHALDTVGREVREDLNYNMDRELLYRVCRRYGACLSPKAYACFRWHQSGKSESNLLKADMEYADLHLSYRYDDPARERLKHQVGNMRRAKGYTRFARNKGASLESVGALLKAAVYDPRLLRQLIYYGTWLRAVGLKRADR
jgi:glycosyltransferase involved in cell wall biosynthesis